MFDYDAERLRGVMVEIARSNISSDAWDWLHEKISLSEISSINSIFSRMPRMTGKDAVRVSPSDAESLEDLKPGFGLVNWTADRLGRVCLLMHIDPSDKERYLKTVEDLFLAAEMGELVALYSALPLLAYPEHWKFRCAEGIRSNMANVLEAIMYANPYPAKYLDESAWNQLVMKAFFTEKDIKRINGFDERANAELARILSDYAHERWAAGRSVNPLLWRATSGFIDQQIKDDLGKVLSDGDLRERKAAALTIFKSNSPEAKGLLKNYADLVSDIENKKLTWDTL
ncbi:EboA domain-containing protein [Daejeonella lutea]|uniref:Uncharacterized protein n=1 Tax=Daejeonella lutea TaxID=572036 RepID=A0A1T5EDY3_9SPHI|nr:EboA domain-containing protein [Daejeonella lutea]SKB82028.1 hypothetical protein SAMN05661099_2917 [Daejeonella lutea]